MGEMKASVFNDLPVNLEGIRITSGVIDSLVADISPVVEARCLRRPDEALIKFVWEAVRQGVLQTTGLK